MACDRSRLACVALITLLPLAGCSIYSVPGADPAPVETRPSPTPGSSTSTPTPVPVPEPVPPEPNDSNAYGGLVTQASTAADRGDYEQALALLERAQRIDPDSAEIYLELAKTYAAKGDAALARATAERGLLYCRSQSDCDALRSYARP